MLNVGGHAPYRYNDRDMHRAWADNCYGTRQFLMDNYVRFSRITGTHSTGGASRARRAITFLMLGDKTDIKAGTVTKQDAGIDVGPRAISPCASWPTREDRRARRGVERAALTRGLEYSGA